MLMKQQDLYQYLKLIDGTPVTVAKEVGTVDYEKGELIFGPLNITSKPKLLVML